MKYKSKEKQSSRVILINRKLMQKHLLKMDGLKPVMQVTLKAMQL
jgi:hypothetical protein